MLGALLQQTLVFGTYAISTSIAVGGCDLFEIQGNKYGKFTTEGMGSPPYYAVILFMVSFVTSQLAGIIIIVIFLKT